MEDWDLLLNNEELYRVYSDLGFEMIRVPVFSGDRNTNILKRVDAVLKHIPEDVLLHDGKIKELYL